jgi:hypothetical protein
MGAAWERHAMCESVFIQPSYDSVVATTIFRQDNSVDQKNAPILSRLSCHAHRDLFRAPFNTELVYVTLPMNRYLESVELCSLMMVVDATDQYVGT